jgi:hypothetical protein
MGKDLSHTFPRLTALALLAAVVAAGCEGVSAPNVVAPANVRITGPEDGSFVNSEIIDVRGQAELGTLVYVYVDDAFRGSGTAYQTQPPQDLAVFRVEDVDLGSEETEKTIVAVAANPDGSTAAHGDTVSVVLDLTPPPADLVRIDGAAETGPGEWEASGPWVDAYGRTDTTAIIVRVRWQTPDFIIDYTPEDTEVVPGEPGEPDSVRAHFRINGPSLPAGADSTRAYVFQTIDAADNYTQTFFTIRWVGGETSCLDIDDATELVLLEIVGSDTLEKQVRRRSAVVAAGDTVRSLGGYEEFVARADSWLFCIDDLCGAHWKHDCRYVFVAIADCLYDVIDAYWPPDDWGEMTTVGSWGCP